MDPSRCASRLIRAGKKVPSLSHSTEDVTGKDETPEAVFWNLKRLNLILFLCANQVRRGLLGAAGAYQE